ncbi:MAG: serine hydrolase, partial [Oscillochloris sp.]|nr:serine hydrolase [Oscillochloris sp.]
TPEPVFAAGSQILGVDVGNLDRAAAAEAVAAAAADLPTTLNLRAGPARLNLRLSDIGLDDPAADLLALAEPELDGAALQLGLNDLVLAEPLRKAIDALASEVALPSDFRLITSTNVLSRSFAYRPGRDLDTAAAYELVLEELNTGLPARPIELPIIGDDTPPAPDFARLEAEIAALAEEWNGVVGLKLIDLASGDEIAYNAGTVFAGASTIKVAIMLYAYTQLDSFDKLEEQWLEEMIVESDNLAANGLLAAAGGGRGTEYAFAGADAMSTWLQEDLGLEHTYLYVPYETSDYIALYKPRFRCGPSGRVGDPPYTEMGACLRATPEAMAQIYVWIDQCANDKGPLLEYDKLNPERCREMLDRLESNGDKTRMVAGIPAGVRVEHKSGWIEDMQADVGSVRSPGGDYVLAVYIYKPLSGGRFRWTDEEMAPAVAAFSRLVYSAYNPTVLEE